MFIHVYKHFNKNFKDANDANDHWYKLLTQTENFILESLQCVAKWQSGCKLEFVNPYYFNDQMYFLYQVPVNNLVSKIHTGAFKSNNKTFKKNAETKIKENVDQIFFRLHMFHLNYKNYCNLLKNRFV